MLAAEPFTLEHFRAWCLGLELDNGKPFVLEVFQESLAADVFAGVPICWLIVPEGNGKTTLVAALALYHCEFTVAAAVAVAASSREQAEILYRQARGFVQRSDRLSVLFVCQDGYRRVKLRGTEARIQVMAADDRTGDGVISTFAILDELHRHKDLKLYDVWSGKLDKRDGQLVVISTAGEPGGEFETARDRIRQEAVEVERVGRCFVRAVGPGGEVLHEWAVPEDGDVEDLELVAEANPFSGVTAKRLAAKRKRTRTLQHWRRFTCNLPTRGDEAAIQELEWAAARTDERIPEGVPIWVGLDVAWKIDTTALVPFWMPDLSRRLLGPAVILEPPGDGTMLDGRDVEHAFRDLHERNPIEIVVMDMHRAEQLAQWLSDELGVRVVERVQSSTMMAEEYDRFMEGLRNGCLRHSGDAGLTRHALNAIAKQDSSGRTKFERPKESRRSQEQDRRVIDALKAAAMVHATAVGDTATSVYETRGLLVLGGLSGVSADR